MGVVDGDAGWFTVQGQQPAGAARVLGEPGRPFLRAAVGAPPAVGRADPGQDFGYQWQAVVCDGQGQSGDRRSGVERARVGHLDVCHDLRHPVKATFWDAVRLAGWRTASWLRVPVLHYRALVDLLPAVVPNGERPIPAWRGQDLITRPVPSGGPGRS